MSSINANNLGFLPENDGATNHNIKVVGLHILCNGVESTGFGATAKKVGLRAQVAFLHVENLEVRDFPV